MTNFMKKHHAFGERNPDICTRARRVTAAALALLLGAGINTTASALMLDYVWNGSIPIPDNDATGVFAEIDVMDNGTIEDLDVDIVIGHTFQGDLIIELEQVGGPTAPLIYRAGDSDDVGFGFSADNFGTVAAPFIFDDEAAAFYDSAAPDGIGATPDPGIANVGGNWIPYGSQASGLTQTLSLFDGLDIFGTWRLHVSDNASADTGDIQQFSLHVTTVEEMPEPAMVALFGFGLTGLLVAGRRRSREHRGVAG